MKIFKTLSVLSLSLLASCSWTERQVDGVYEWGDKNMPTYDSKPEAATPSSGSTSMIPSSYNGYPYTANTPRKSFPEAGVSGGDATASGPNADRQLTPGQTPVLEYTTTPAPTLK